MRYLPVAWVSISSRDRRVTAPVSGEGGPFRNTDRKGERLGESRSQSARHSRRAFPHFRGRGPRVTEFYVGYASKMPPGIARLVRWVVAGVLIGAGLTALALVTHQSVFPPVFF